MEWDILHQRRAAQARFVRLRPMRVVYRSLLTGAFLAAGSASLAFGQAAPSPAPLSDTAVASAIQFGDTATRPPFAALVPGAPMILVYGPRDRIALAAYLAKQRHQRFTADSADASMRAPVVLVSIVPHGTVIAAITLVDVMSGSVSDVLRPTSVDTLRGGGMIVEARFTPQRILAHPSLTVKWNTGSVVLPLPRLKLN